MIIYFEQMVDKVYPRGLQLNKANSSDREPPLLELSLPINVFYLLYLM